MPLTTKSASQAAEKWKRVTPDRVDDYQNGLANPSTPWAAASAAAASRYAAGVQDAIKDNRFATGVQRAGDGTWQQMAQAKGPGRFTEGVAVSGPVYEAAMGPVMNTIRNTQLPERFPRGDPRNIQRVAAIAAALRKLKTTSTR